MQKTTAVVRMSSILGQFHRQLYEKMPKLLVMIPAAAASQPMRISLVSSPHSYPRLSMKIKERIEKAPIKSQGTAL